MSAGMLAEFSPSQTSQAGETSNAHFQVTEKNTFINIIVEDYDEDDVHVVPTRRSSSVPPSLRIACADSRNDSELGRSFSEDKSTVSGSSDSQSSAGSDSDVVEGGHSPSADPSQVGAKLPGLIELLPPEVLPAKPSTPGDLSPTKTPLRTSSKAFAPRCLQRFLAPQAAAGPAGHPAAMPSLVTAWMSQAHATQFLSRCASIVDDLRLTLINTKCVNGVQVRMGEHCWSVAVMLTRDVRNDATLEVAKTCLLDGAANSENVYVRGYSTQPFVSTPFGFSGFLCGVKDNAAACWDMYSTGYCRRGRRCTWEHPEQQARVSVVIKRVDE